METKFYLALFFSLFSLSLLISCSKDEIPDETEDKENSFEITVTPISGEYEIDKPIEFKVTANQNMMSVGIGTYGIASADTLDFKSLISLDTSGLSQEAHVFTGFEVPGEYIVKIKAENKDLDFDVEKLKINVQRGNAVKITGLKIISFYEKDEIWDVQNERSPDFIGTVLMRDVLASTFNETPQTDMSTWIRPEDKSLGNELYWNLENEDLYIAPDFRFAFDLIGMKNDGTSVPLREIYPSVPKYHRLDQYLSSKPDSIKIVEDNGNLAVVFNLEW